MHMYVCTNTHMHTHTHTHTHTPTHTYKYVASQGGKIVYGVDATNLSATLGPMAGTIGRIVFNFPCLEARPDAAAAAASSRLKAVSIMDLITGADQRASTESPELEVQDRDQDQDQDQDWFDQTESGFAKSSHKDQHAFLRAFFESLLQYQCASPTLSPACEVYVCVCVYCVDCDPDCDHHPDPKPNPRCN